MGDVGALKRAVRTCDVPLIKSLVKGGVSVNQRLWYGTTLLQEAVTQAHVEMVSCFIQVGKANLDAQNDGGKTALHIASRAGHEAILDLLLEAGAKVNIQCLDKTTSLHLAMWKSKMAIVEKLVDAGANPNLQDQDCWTPLHWGVENGNFELVKLLINNGAKTNVVSKVLMTPLTLSLTKRHLDITRYLLVMGAGIDIIEDSEKKPVSFFSLMLEPALLKNHNTEVLQLVDTMMEAGCDIWLERKTLLSKQPQAGSLAERLHQVLLSKLSTPPTLQESCRFFLRQYLHHHYQKQQPLHQHKLYIDKIIALEIPKHLEDFLLTRTERIQIRCRAKKPPKRSPVVPPQPSDTTTTTTATTSTTTTTTKTKIKLKQPKTQNNYVKTKPENIIHLKKNNSSFSSGKEMAKLEQTHPSQMRSSAKCRTSNCNSNKPYKNLPLPQQPLPNKIVKSPSRRVTLLEDPFPGHPASQPLLSIHFCPQPQQNRFYKRNSPIPRQTYPPSCHQVRQLPRFSPNTSLECNPPERNVTQKKRSWRSNKPA